jgi:hypothetical protein
MFFKVRIQHVLRFISILIYLLTLPYTRMDIRLETRECFINVMLWIT